MANELERMGLLYSVDRSAFASYCLAWDRLVNAEKIIQEKGLTMVFPRDDGSAYEQVRPEVAVSNKAMTQIRAFCIEFGLTPSSRSRMQLPEEEGEKSKLAELLD
jgi:P27 family predicted phage terminase small subunit